MLNNWFTNAPAMTKKMPIVQDRIVDYVESARIRTCDCGDAYARHGRIIRIIHNSADLGVRTNQD